MLILSVVENETQKLQRTPKVTQLVHARLEWDSRSVGPQAWALGLHLKSVFSRVRIGMCDSMITRQIGLFA